jgi:hypothetical protein
MNEELLRERLQQVAVDDGSVEVAGDLARGHAALRRRRRLVTGGSVVATAGLVAAVFVTAGAMAGGDGGGSSGAPIADQSTPEPDVPEPTTEPPADYPKPDDTRASDRPEAELSVSPPSSVDPGEGMPVAAHEQWRNDLYRLAQDVIDPGGKYLSYDTQSLQRGGDGDRVYYGVKLGWAAKKDSGEGMVQVSVASPGASGLVGPCGYFGPCDEVERSGRLVRLSGDPASGEGYAVLVTQPDGEEVSIVVDPLFGNNALTPTTAPLPTLEDVLDLAVHPDLNLPT